MILIILILVALSLAGAVFYSLQKERLKNLALQEELEDIKMKQRITETKLEESKNALATLEVKLQEAEGKLKEAQSQIDTLTQGLKEEKNAKQEALSQIEQLKTELEQQKDLRSDLERRLTKTQKDLENMQVRLNVLESKKGELETKIKDLETQAKQAQGVELGKIVVSPEAATSVQTPAEVSTEKQKETPVSDSGGKVLVMNKDYNFVIINLGSRDGVGIGDIFSVYHSNKYMGDIKVEKIHDSMSAAGFESLEMKDKISEGDKVIRKTK